ncbi:unnamed protein product [Rotaria sp. Silwood2]|nr:unnamed protein product [Rotaria sp. Silwood2]
MSGSIDALLPSCATESTVGMGKVENKEAPSLDEGPKGSANADNLTQKASANNNNIGEQATAAIHGCQNSAITVPATLSDAAENQLIETGNNPLEQNRKASDMQDSPDASKTLTGVQNISTNQLATGNDPNGMQSLNASTNQLEEGKEPNNTQIPLDIQKTSTVMETGESTTVINKSSLMDSRCQFRAEQSWVDLKFHPGQISIKKPDELAKEMIDPPIDIDTNILNRIKGSMFGMALGDALGAHVEFRPRGFLVANPVTDMQGGGTWGLVKGQTYEV